MGIKTKHSCRCDKCAKQFPIWFYFVDSLYEALRVNGWIVTKEPEFVALAEDAPAFICPECFEKLKP